MKKFYWIISVVLVLAAGCDINQQEDEIVRVRKRTWKGPNVTIGSEVNTNGLFGAGLVEPTRVMFKADGENYTYGNFLDDFGWRMEFVAHRIWWRPAKDWLSATNRITEGILSTKIATFLGNRWLEKKQIEPDEGIRARIEGRYVRNFGRGVTNLTQVLGRLPSEGQRQALLTNILQEARMQTYFEVNCSNEWFVTEKAVDDWEKMVAADREQASKTNRVLYALATNLCQRARRGEDFESLVERYSHESDRRLGGDLGECDETDFNQDEPQVWRIINRLKDGEISDPIDTVEGLAVYRCVKRLSAKESQCGTPQIHLARLVLHRAISFPDYTRDEIREELKERSKNDLRTRLQQESFEGVPIEFPDGIGFLPREIAVGFLARVTEQENEKRQAAEAAAAQNVQKKSADSSTNTVPRPGSAEKKPEVK